MNWVALIIANLPAIIQGGTAVVDFVAKVRAAAQQTNEWTPENESAFINLLADAYNLPEWKTDAEKAAPAPTTAPTAP